MKTLMTMLALAIGLTFGMGTFVQAADAPKAAEKKAEKKDEGKKAEKKDEKKAEKK
jgi:hypothetical protein